MIVDACDLFIEIALRAWEELADRHDYLIGLDERGITDTIVYYIIKHHSSYPGRIIKVRKAVRESIEGNDIDLYIRVFGGGYARIALQAKVLFPPAVKPLPKSGIKPNPPLHSKYYEGIEKGRGTRGYQWNMLKKWERSGLFKAYYLLYNGFSDAQMKACGINTKVRFYPYFGCSLVRPTVVERLTRSSKGKVRGRYVRTAPAYEDFHSVKNPAAKPWHSLVCDTSFMVDYKAKLYSNTEIMSNDLFITLERLQEENTQDKLKGIDIPVTNDTTLASSSQEGFSPIYQIIID